MNMTRNGEPGARGGVVLVVVDGANDTGTAGAGVVVGTVGNAAAVVPVSTVLLAGTRGAA